MNIDLETLSELIDLFSKSSAEEMKVKRGDNLKVVLKEPGKRQKKPPSSSSDQSEPELVTISSSMVGRFFRKTSSEDTPWVKEGEIVEQGDRLGFIKSLEIKAEQIEADQKGEIKTFKVEDGEVVEWGQELLTIRPFPSKEET